MQDSVAATDTRQVLPLCFKGVSVRADTALILEGIELAIGAGGPTVLMGPNGAGKTTLLRLMMGLMVPTAGKITFADRETPPRGSRAIVFQRPVMLRRTVAANVAFALSAAGRTPDPAEVRKLLQIARISELADRPARRLSGGEQQRLALARALARQPQLLLLDEPTANLDPAATKLVEELIAQVSAAGLKIVMSTHDIGQARRLASEVVFLAKRRLIEHAPAQRFFMEPVSKETRCFLAGDLVV